MNLSAYVINLFLMILYQFLFHRIKKWSSRGRALEHLVSSATNFFVNWPILHNYCEWKNRDGNIEGSPKTNFKDFFHTFNVVVVVLPV